jgi:DNA (cytosine-5)-methyltransferase 1
LIAELICVSTGQAGADIGIGIGTTPNCDHEAPIVTAPLTQNPYADNESRESLLVTHALRADGFDASEDGTGRGIPVVPIAICTAGVMTPRMAVRRLTPRECERLQGFPDDYTLVEYRGKLAADGPRYRALGNSMAVPVMRWIGERISVVESITERPEK